VLGLGLSLRASGGRGFSPATLFALAEPGVWFDPSPQTCFTDTAGTTPAAVGQAVALMLDKSRGLVLGPELVTNGDFSGGTTGWEGFNASSVISVVSGEITASNTAPNTSSIGAAQVMSGLVVGRTYKVTGTLRAAGDAETVELAVTNNARDTFVARGTLITSTTNVTTELVFVATQTNNVLYLRSGRSVVATGWSGGFFDNITMRELPGNHATQSITASRPTLARVPANGRRNILVGTATLATQIRVVTAAQHTLSFQGTGTVTLTGASTAGPLVGTGATDTVSLTFTPTAGNLTLTVSGSVTLAQLELGAVRTGYQTVGTTTFDVTEAGQADNWHLSFDGIDDSMVTPTITPNTDKAQVFAGVRKLSDATSLPVIYGHGVQLNGVNAGEVALFARAASSAPTYAFRSIGTIEATTGVTTGYPAPITNVLTGIGDISGDVARLRIDGAQVAETLTDQGTGNFLAYASAIGARGGSSLRFTGHIYSLVARFGPNLDTDTIEKVEAYIANRTAGVSL